MSIIVATACCDIFCAAWDFSKRSIYHNISAKVIVVMQNNSNGKFVEHYSVIILDYLG